MGYEGLEGGCSLLWMPRAWQGRTWHHLLVPMWSLQGTGVGCYMAQGCKGVNSMTSLGGRTAAAGRSEQAKIGNLDSPSSQADSAAAAIWQHTAPRACAKACTRNISGAAGRRAALRGLFCWQHSHLCVLCDRRPACVVTCILTRTWVGPGRISLPCCWGVFLQMCGSGGMLRVLALLLPEHRTPTVASDLTMVNGQPCL
jgi:hypothetical protein